MPRSFSRPRPAGQGALPFAVCTTVLIRQPSHTRTGGLAAISNSPGAQPASVSKRSGRRRRWRACSGATAHLCLSGGVEMAGIRAPCDKAFRYAVHRGDTRVISPSERAGQINPPSLGRGEGGYLDQLERNGYWTISVRNDVDRSECGIPCRTHVPSELSLDWDPENYGQAQTSTYRLLAATELGRACGEFSRLSLPSRALRR
jgi:hypothetical protein